MAKRIKCADVGPDCDYEAMADTEEELLELVTEHARRAHGIEEITPELRRKVEAAMREA
ncbi:MAG TPA: DUF1059 domain-containing protein [Longimicrobiales bacterium]|nr:DUF1059 domain-containing protein [Longimicrobiales bacterium]